MHRRTTIAWLLVGLSSALASGCDRGGEVSRYRVPKPHVLAKTNNGNPDKKPAKANSAPVPRRMLAAIVPRGDRAWFFRLVGPPDEVADQVDDFRALVKSLRFTGDDAPPTWTLPAGWREQPGSGMRYATIAIPAAEPLDLSVTVLPRNEPDLDTYALSNVNRWRGQLGLPALSRDRLKDETESLDVDGQPLTLVDLTGMMTEGGGMARPPFAGGQGPPAGISPPAGPPPPGASPPRVSGPTSAPAGAPRLSYDVPEGWKPSEAGGLRRAAFTIGDGAKTAEVTVIDLDPGAGTLLANINRWRKQIDLPDASQQEVDREVKKIEVGPLAGDYVELVGPEKAILGVVLQEAGRTWFFKLMGDAELVRNEKDRFEAFVRSVKLGGAG